MRVLLLAFRRLAASLPTLFVVLAGLFLLLQLAPGDTVDALVAQMGGGDAAMMEELRRFYGLDVSVAVQLGRYLWRLVQLDLGFSAIYGKPVSAVILERLPTTLLLMGSALSFAFAGGMALGVLAARKVNRWPDTLISTLGLDLLRHSVLLVRPDGHRDLRGQSRLVPAGGFEEIGAGYTGFRRIRRYRMASPAADLHARVDFPCHLSADHARLHAGSAESGIRSHRARQRTEHGAWSFVVTCCATRFCPWSR